jgi:hypothetical protein
MAEIFRCSIERWTGNWGDPLVPGTVTMLAYAAAGPLVWRVSTRIDRSEGQLWRLCAFFFLFQVFNIHLDMHAWPTAFGHCLAHAQGWYGERGAVKLAAAVMIGAATGLVLLVGVIAYWRRIRANALLVAGVGIAAGITLARGVGWSAAEQIYNHRVGPFRWAVLIELSGVAAAALAALLRLRLLRRVRLERLLSRH